MLKKLPDLIDPLHAARNNMQFEVSLELGSMPRLAQEILNRDALVEVNLKFYEDQYLRSPRFTLKVKAVLELECQASLDTFNLEVEEEVDAVFVESMALAEDLDESLEVYELPEDRIATLELIEDELLLAIPMAPRKEDALIMDVSGVNDFDVAEIVEEKVNPFEDLKKLLH